MRAKYVFAFSVILLFPLTIHCQTLKIRGVVYDKETNEPVSFASIGLNDNVSGTISDINGEFYLEKHSNADSIHVSFLGYKTTIIPIRKGGYNDLKIYLEPENIELEEVVVTPGENHAHKVLRNIRKNKEKNRMSNLQSFRCEVYNKMELDFDNVNEKLQNRKALNQFQFVFDNMDTSALTGKAYLPMFITESVSDYYFDAPNKEREVIKASKIAGIEDPSLSQYTGVVFQKVDIYDNYMIMMTEGFVSPISDLGLLYYKYYLIDTVTKNGILYYNIGFDPKRKGEKTFKGYFIAEDGTFAVTNIKMTLNEGVNLNYINDFSIQIDFNKVNDSLWFLSKEYYEVEFNIRESGKGFVGKKTTYYSDVHVNEPVPKEIQKMHTRTRVQVDAANKPDDYWSLARPGALTPKEERIYTTIDSMKNVPVFNTAVNVVNMFASYHYDLGWFEYGPYYKTISYNEIEGYRLRLGGRTSSEISKTHRFHGYGAYGFMDNKFKYELGYTSYIKRYPWTNAGLKFTHDIKQLGQSENAFTEDNFMTTFLQRNPNYKLTLINKYEGFFERDWFEGFSNKISFMHREVFPTRYIPFNYTNEAGETLQQDHIVSFEVTFNTHFALHEQFVYGTFERTSLSTALPIFDFDFTLGMPRVLGSQYEYYKFMLRVKDVLDVSPFGWFKYIGEGGKIIGKLPYTLLELHKGNETYAYDIYAFNRMNYYEFASDEYLRFFAEQHFMGFFLNKIPLMKKLKLREVLYGQALIGNLTQDHESVMLFPEGLSSLRGPYVEAGMGIENILKVIRIDAVWRLTQTDKPQNVILMASLQLQL
ncbi:MAG: carboxypeptidase-like regulatory domain-containing protein [Bacteroidales bacterium]|nr:carboxypeptidase-like regulatory domain-containing protein [Bacteroidales bacterium]